jgi:hypothetical protein
LANGVLAPNNRAAASAGVAERNDMNESGPQVTAAVVGVIVNLAVFFAYHVLWPQGLHGHFEWLSAVIGVAAAIALFRFRSASSRSCSAPGWPVWH